VLPVHQRTGPSEEEEERLEETLQRLLLLEILFIWYPQENFLEE
jgi:hypothetical protein